MPPPLTRLFFLPFSLSLSRSLVLAERGRVSRELSRKKKKRATLNNRVFLSSLSLDAKGEQDIFFYSPMDTILLLACA